MECVDKFCKIAKEVIMMHKVVNETVNLKLKKKWSVQTIVEDSVVIILINDAFP